MIMPGSVPTTQEMNILRELIEEQQKQEELVEKEVQEQDKEEEQLEEELWKKYPLPMIPSMISMGLDYQNLGTPPKVYPGSNGFLFPNMVK